MGKCAFNTALLVEGVLLCFLLFFSCRHLLPAAPFFKVVARTGLEEERAGVEGASRSGVWIVGQAHGEETRST